MSRRKHLDPPVEICLSIPESLRAWLEVHLWSDVDGRVPAGAYTRFLQARIEEYQTWKDLDLHPLGFPQGFFIRGPEEMVKELEAKLKGEQA